MNIGIVNQENQEQQLSLLADCEETITLPNEMKTEFLTEIIRNNKEAQFKVASLEAIDLQIIQLLPSFKLLKKQNQVIYFLKRDRQNKLSQVEYFDEIYHLALLEEEKIKKRTVLGIKKAREEGVIVGRPTIKQSDIAKIQKLHDLEKKTFREIATICNVSVGTAYKYASQATKFY